MLITLFIGCHFGLKRQEGKVNGPHRYSEKKMQVLTMFRTNCSIMFTKGYSMEDI
jgi:hypothetical protein